MIRLAAVTTFLLAASCLAASAMAEIIAGDFNEFVTSNIPDFTASNAPNMNGAYVFSVTPGGKPGKMPAKFSDYPGGVEYYDVLSPPMTTFYSQVWWSPLAPTPLPAELVRKYANKSMAIVGWEIDQVRVDANGTEHSVPISASYNHHYVALMIGGPSSFRKIKLTGPDDPHAAEVLRHSHGHIAWDQEHYIIKREAGDTGTTAFMTSANGGEYRKSYHGFAPGHAVVINSPTALQISPMQIDTWNRDKMDISGPVPPKFVPGPLPRAAQAPEKNPQYSGLLECPMTTRLTRVVDGGYVWHNGVVGCANQPILSSQECFHAAAATLDGDGSSLAFVNTTGLDPAKPPGCSASSSSTDLLTVNVFFNALRNSTTLCGADGATVFSGAAAPPSLDGRVHAAVSLDANANLATITLVGPSDVWFAVGFGGSTMEDRPWTLVVEGANGTCRVSERKLGGPRDLSHVAGDLLEASVKVVSVTSTAEGTRTVILSRPMRGAGAGYYNFSVGQTTNPSVPIIAAYGSGPTLAYHEAKVPSKLTLLPVGAAAAGSCVCPAAPPAFGSATGQLVYHPNASQAADTGAGSVAFGGYKVCAPYPTTVLLRQRNPTCDIRHYRGGQWACHHKWSLLDADQDIPWTDRPLVVHHKWRLWVQPYNASYHQPVRYGFDTDLLLGSPYEYDVPVCGDDVPGCSRDAEGTWIHTISGSKMGQHHFAALNFHCHAPACISMSVYACDKGTALADCNATAPSARLICEQSPVYGGTSDPALHGTRFDEPGYIAIPDCFWGPAENGLEPPPDLTGVPLHMVKKANATWPHYGEMAGGQPWVY